MSEIGDSVRIVGEKLIENCETFAHNSSGAHFWKHAAMNIRENLKGIFTPDGLCQGASQIRDNVVHMCQTFKPKVM